MIGFFKRTAAAAAPDTSALGSTVLALPMPAGAVVAPGCTGVVFDQGGHIRRVAAGGRIVLAAHESACCFHPGPYSIDLLPFQASPELGLRLTFAVDAPDPRVTQQRFDLYLISEAGSGMTLAGQAGVMQGALQRELAQGNLELPPCTSLAEWNAFRAGLNQLLYIRFGVTVEDCVPVDLGESVDYAQILLARALPTAQALPVQHASAAPVPFDAAEIDVQAMRRLFLELPCVMCALRLAVLPAGQSLFHQHQALLRRLDCVSLEVATMPALELAAPKLALSAQHRTRRARHSSAAAAALDEAWALLARLALADAPQLDQLFDEADRIVANLERHSAARRVAVPESEAP